MNEPVGYGFDTASHMDSMVDIDSTRANVFLQCKTFSDLCLPMWLSFPVNNSTCASTV